MVETKTVLVAGATGQQGGMVARSLLRRGHRVRGLTRRPAKIRGLKAAGIEGVLGDLSEEESLRPHLRGVDGFFILTTPFGEGFSVDVRKEVRQGMTAVKAAQAADVPHVVLASVASADQNTRVPHFESKARVERLLRETGLRHTIVRPVFFMENVTSPWLLPALHAGTLALPLPPGLRLQMVAVRDIGEIVVRALEAPEVAAGKTVELAGDEMTLADLTGRLSVALGRPVAYVEQSEDVARQGMAEDTLRMYQWFKEVGYRVDIAALMAEWGYRMTRFDEFLDGADLGALA